MAIDARYAASASGSSRRKPTDLFGGDLEKFARTETAGYSACHMQAYRPPHWWVCGHDPANRSRNRHRNMRRHVGIKLFTKII
jgi:hypothetical protein